MGENTVNNNVNISFPSSLIEKNGVINITISQGAEELVKEQATKTVDVSKADELDLAEIKKLDLKATAFKLSQTNLVGDIDFEELDIDQDPEFKEFQCSILLKFLLLPGFPPDLIPVHGPPYT